MSDTPRTDFVAHESGDTEWNRFPNRFARMMAHACILERELAEASKDAERGGWVPIAEAPQYVQGRDALLGQWVAGYGWKKVTLWEREWTRDDCIRRGATHWWPHLCEMPDPMLAATGKEKP